ncbi:hypothetical protein PTKIN_Ptkin01aG0371800 [Pterospermum kingtungense]
MQIATVLREDQEVQNLTRHEENLRILRKFLKVNQGGIEGVFFSTSFPSEEREAEERVKKMATRLAMVSLREWMLSGVEEKSFKNVAKLILHVFDLEDVERFNSKDKLREQYKRFYDENLSHLKSDENPYELVAKGKIKFDGFPLLGEQDIGYILRSYSCQVADGKGEIEFSDVVPLLDFGLDGDLENGCFKEGCHGHFVEMARTVLLQYVPLQEDIKMHSILECLVFNCRRTLNGFLLEAISDAVGKLTKEEHRDDGLTKKISFYLSNIADDRFTRLSYVSAPAAHFVVYGPSGTTFFDSFAQEVYQLVKIANAPRRLQCHRFISKHHILWAAVRFTVYKDYIDNLVKDLGLRDVVEVPAARRPPYSVYLSARQIANRQCQKLVRVEHVVVAAVYEMCKVGRHKLGLYEFIKRECVRKFFLAVEDSKKRSRGSSIFLKFDAETVGYEKEGKIATQNSFHYLELEILSMTVNAISLAISQQAIVQELADAVKEVKVPTRTVSDMVLVEETNEKIVTRQPESSHQGDAVKHAVPKAMQIAKVSSEDQEGQKLTRHGENLLILEKFLKINKGGSDGVFFSTSLPSEERDVEERVKKMATRLAMVSLRKWMLSGVDGLVEKVRGDCGAFEERSFKSVAKLMLHAYDKEDFERFNSRDTLRAEYKKFYDENLFHLRSTENPYELVAKGKIKFDGFPLLREQDVGKLFESYSYQGADGTLLNEFSGLVRLVNFGFYLCSPYCFEEGCHDRFVEMARTALLQYIRLEEDVKMHSILDCLVCRCGSTKKRFLDDVCVDVGIPESKEHQSDKLNRTIYRDLFSMIEERCRMLRYSSVPAAAFVRYGPSGALYGSFAEEVSCLVQIADARRRFQSQRFISKHHIHWASRFTIYKGLIDDLVEALGITILVEGPAAKRPPYGIYISARATADCHGAKLVGVEHVVVAVAYEMCKVRRSEKDLEEFNNRGRVIEFLRAVKDSKGRSGASSIFMDFSRVPAASCKRQGTPKMPGMVLYRGPDGTCFRTREEALAHGIGRKFQKQQEADGGKWASKSDKKVGPVQKPTQSGLKIEPHKKPWVGIGYSQRTKRV